MDVIQKVKFPCPVRRVRIVVENGKWKIRKEVRIPSMTISQTVDIPSTKKRSGISGFWIESTDKKERVFYRVFQENPFEPTVEVFDSKGNPSRAHVKQTTFEFEVLIPDTPKASHLNFYSDVNDQGKRNITSNKLVTLPLGKGDSHELR